MDKHLGVYIHIPFCASKCRYCDFYSQPANGALMNRYMRAVCQHIEESAAMLAPYYIDTVYFGGGTPSFFGARRICEILNTIKDEHPIVPEVIRFRYISKLRSIGWTPAVTFAEGFQRIIKEKEKRSN